MKDLAEALRSLTPKLTWPHYVVGGVIAFFAMTFEHVRSWVGVAHLLCLGLGIILLSAFAQWLCSSRRGKRLTKGRASGTTDPG